MIWSDIRNNFEEEIEGQGKTILIDAWLTEDENEGGQVIAHVFKSEAGQSVVKYLDERAKEDEYAQEIIKESIKRLVEE